VYDHGALHTDHAYALKKEVYTQAVTLVRDEKKLVPIQSDACVVLHIHGLRTPADIVRREQAIRAEINALVDAGRDLVVVLYGTPYALPLFDRVGTVLIAYEDDPDAVDAVARILQGDLVATGQLPVRME
jgi:hypothetical protein